MNTDTTDGLAAQGVRSAVSPAPKVARKMRQTSEDNYVGDGDYRMQREYGLAPNGSSIGGRWVLRGPDAQWLDCDQDRHKLLERHGFVTA